ncbi:YadA C-terminal domain-containing protein [Enterobacter mori]|uniref:YadA C-terminal domain-containing protein n=1 Tax=Enterobacter mori TaxID=539813 RepID=UPI002112748F|nr:YadA-like family protein [Enterobacter mori]WKW36458.1 YadA-like family protein [Enterobacter mori]
MKFIKTAVASITLYAISGSVFATTYFSMQEKSDAIQHIRDEANAANSLYKLNIQKFNLDRDHYTQQDQAISDKAMDIIKNAGARITEIQQASIVPVPKPTQTSTPVVSMTNLNPALKKPVLPPQQIPQKLNGSQHPTNEHHITNAPVKLPYIIPVHTVTPLVNLTPSIKPQSVPTPKYNNIALIGSHLDSNVTDAQRLTAILENVPKPVDGVDGKKGAKGDKGETGATGAQGVAGIKGRNGVNGHNGKDGTSTTVTRMQIDTATQTKVANNSQAITATVQELQATRQTLQAMNNNTNQQFRSLRDEVDDNKKQANAGISGAMAMAGLPQVQTNQRVMFSAGGATYEGESAIAVGASVNFNPHVIGKVSFSDDTANNMGASVGIGVGF